MKKLRVFDYTLYSLIILAGIGLDQLTKFLAVNYFNVDLANPPINGSLTFPVWEDVFHFTFVANRGMAFGMLPNHRWVFMLFSTVAIIALAAYLYLGYAQTKLYSIAAALIISGGIGNMIDRIWLEFVIDFIDFRIINFAVFNVADSFVCIGAGLLILALVLDLVKEAKNNKKSKGAKK